MLTNTANINLNSTLNNKNKAKESILVVDDRPENLRLLSDILSKLNYKVRKVTSGKQAIEAAQIDPPSLILLDIMMPDMNGYEVCQHLKSQERTLEIPVIFLSALDKSFDKVKAFEAGGVDYVTKPFQVEEIIVRVQNQLTILRQKISLKEQQKLLEIQNEQLKQEIQERKQIESALEKAKIAAEEANLSKSRFLANMSHEIRTPMNGVIGMNQLLMMTNLNKEQKYYTSVIQESAKSLLNIINDILDLSKIESGKLELEHRAFRLEDVLQFVCGLMHQSALEKQISLQSSILSSLPQVIEGDEYRLRQILLNLVSNAIKFTEKGFVSVNIEYDEPSKLLHFIVADSGIGISSDRLDHLFDPFTQEDTSTSRKYGGTGLGLAICKSLAEMMGGTIWVESRGNIGGKPNSIFQVVNSQNEINSELQGSVFHFTIAASIPSQTQLIDRLELTSTENLQISDRLPLKILLVEDNPMNQKLATLMMQKFGYSVDIANNGIEAIQFVEKQVYDLVLMDVQMPEMDGLTATKWIREHLQYQPYIIALTASSSLSDRDTCVNAGMNDYITKPIDFQEIKQVIFKAASLLHININVSSMN
ncbi:MAG: response regulator [Pseudanabaenaceae cyanobacterium bins.39]|nr:response regulator [Pseudanabaenaceae cyanobacterium bins.39]